MKRAPANLSARFRSHLRALQHGRAAAPRHPRLGDAATGSDDSRQGTILSGVGNNLEPRPTNFAMISNSLLPLVEDLKTVPGMRAIVLGGSRARGGGDESSDTDLGFITILKARSRLRFWIRSLRNMTIESSQVW